MTHGTMIRTRVNNPDRVYLNSSDDPRTLGDVGFSQFTCTFDTPILGAKKTMLLRASIPNAPEGVSIPNHTLFFWYYQLPAATTVPNVNYLKCVRLYPSNYQPPSGFTAFVRNRFFSDPADFVSVLNAAASAGGDNLTYNPFWAVGDVTFTYNTTTKQITFTGNTAGKFYCPAGWADEDVDISARGGNIQMPNFSGTGTTDQVAIQNYTLNLRVGYAMSGLSLGTQYNRAAAPQTVYADLTNSTYANGTAVPADSFPNLVYSQCVYLLSNITAGVSLGSNKVHNLLAVIPSNAPPLGVISYTALTVNMLSKIVDTIYAITIELRDDANQPFVLPDNAQVNVELAFVYTE